MPGHPGTHTMNTFLAQLILARRSEDAEKWMNILVIVVLAVFWALSGILKARAKKTQQGDAGQSGRRLARRPPPQSRAAREHLAKAARRPAGPAEPPPVRPARSRLAELREAARKFAAEAEEAFRAQTQKRTPKPEAARQPPRVPEHLAQPPEAPPAPRPALLEEPVPAKYLPELLSDYADPDQLRRAILHYEILGRPLALRDPQDSAIGL